MSWSAEGTATVDNATIAGEPTRKVNLSIPGLSAPEHGAKESQVAFVAAKQATSTLLESGALGQGNFNVSLSGHANPGNVPADGWVNDCVTIRITQS